MGDDRVKLLEERLTRLEAAFTQQQPARAAFPPHVVVDPAPYPGGWGYPRPYPRPVVDPAPYPVWGGGHYWPPHPIADPAPFPNPIVDPAASAEHLRATAAAASLGRIGHIGDPATFAHSTIGHIADPAPIDVSRFSVAQLEAMLHTINAERSRLDSMETLIKQQHERLSRSQGEEA